MTASLKFGGILASDHLRASGSAPVVQKTSWQRERDQTDRPSSIGQSVLGRASGFI